MTEALEPTYSVVAYFAKNGDVRQVSRFADEAKAKKSVLQSQLTGQHAEIIGTKLPIKAVRALMANYKEDNNIAAGTVAIPNKPKQVFPRLRPKRPPRIKTRQVETEYGLFEIRSVKALFIAKF